MPSSLLSSTGSYGVASGVGDLKGDGVPTPEGLKGDVLPDATELELGLSDGVRLESGEHAANNAQAITQITVSFDFMGKATSQSG